MGNSSKNPFLPATNSAPRPGDFPIGSALSRAAARMLLRIKEVTAEQEAARPADVVMVFDLGGPIRAKHTVLSRYAEGDGTIIEIIAPAHTFDGECYGCFSVTPGSRLEEALELKRAQPGHFETRS